MVITSESTTRWKSHKPSFYIWVGYETMSFTQNYRELVSPQGLTNYTKSP